MKSSRLLALPDLAGYRLMTCYWVELKHGLMGTYPALTIEPEDIFFCTDKQTLGEILKILPRQRFKVNSSLALVNEANHVAFDITAMVSCHKIKEDSDSVCIISAEDLANMQKTRKSNKPLFKWAPGLISLVEDPSPKEFAEEIQVALERA